MADERDTAWTAPLAAAERSAADGDFDSADRFLREAAMLQERALGPLHGDLANTLNNIGVASESLGRLDEAEAAYRRAYAIAAVAFSPGHPFLVRSENNLRDFCRARGTPFEAISIEPQDATPPVAPPAASLAVRSRPTGRTEEATARGTGAVSAPERRSRAARLAAVVIAAVVAASGLYYVLGGTSDEGADSLVATEPQASPPPAPEVTPALPPSAPAPNAPAAPNRALTPPPPQPRSAAGSLRVVESNVCRNFRPSGSTWSCDPVGETTRPAVHAFYTRLASPRPFQIEHRWYLDDALIQRVRLSIGANNNAGYRTFSRQTITRAQAGNWRVELRSADGAVIQEARFRVELQRE